MNKKWGKKEFGSHIVRDSWRIVINIMLHTSYDADIGALHCILHAAVYVDFQFRMLCNGHVRRLHMDSYIKSIVLSVPLF